VSDLQASHDLRVLRARNWTEIEKRLRPLNAA